MPCRFRPVTLTVCHERALSEWTVNAEKTTVVVQEDVRCNRVHACWKTGEARDLIRTDAGIVDRTDGAGRRVRVAHSGRSRRACRSLWTLRAGWPLRANLAPRKTRLRVLTTRRIVDNAERSIHILVARIDHAIRAWNGR